MRQQIRAGNKPRQNIRAIATITLYIILLTALRYLLIFWQMNKIGAFYKDNDPEVYAKTYYNDVTGMYEVHFYDNTIKEQKLLEKQKKGKKKMRQIGNVEVPQKTFLDVLKLD